MQNDGILERQWWAEEDVRLPMFAALNTFGLYIFWGFIGLTIMAPLLFVGSAVQAAKTANNYHFRGYYKLKKERHIRGARTYGSLALLTVLIISSFFIMI